MTHIWFNAALISIGIFLMIISAYLSIKVQNLFSSEKSWFSFGGKLTKMWAALPVFIMFSLISYCAYLFFYLKRSTINYETLTSAILFFGALFVFIIVFTNFKTFNKLKHEK